jgi:hypothetical protein
MLEKQIVEARLEPAPATRSSAARTGFHLKRVLKGATGIRIAMD